MNAALTVARREFAAYFATPVATVFIVIFLVLSGALTFTLGGFFGRGQADLIPFFGFIPWRVRRIGTGYWVPEVLPPGTFDWHTEIGPANQAAPQPRWNTQPNRRKRKAPRGDDDDTRLVVYRVIPTASGVRE
ncbi:MAG: hypothetical protein WCP77_01675, partial [Roseococcus sp.]